MLDEFRHSHEQPMQLHTCVSRTMGRIISHVLFNRTFSKDKGFDDLLVALKEVTSVLGGKTSIIVGFLFRLKVMFSEEMRAVQKSRDTARRIVNRWIKEEVNNSTPSTSEGYVGVYLQHRKSLMKERDDEGSFTIKRLEANTMNLLLEGTETVSQTVSSMLIELSKHQEVQMALQEELDAVVGRDRLLTWSDKESLPNLYSTIQELYRVASPFLITRFVSNLKETRIDGYLVPRNSLICANLASIHFDPEIYPHPEKFDPKRFLDENGKKINKEGPYPFGLGKRSCIGESLAEMEVFLVIGAILQNFKIIPGRQKGTLNFLSRQ
ncbi:cytochrome P450 2F3 [Caerostris extrusa]|uniref:Cytochrome P450 2F3 n=1 Tax=Caerostris extrusa TaxID=172846 RepID=A0AAV4MBX1_CAEEX|nr:cytochrome P450 2F3 [Caerostris extrusa]